MSLTFSQICDTIDDNCQTSSVTYPFKNKVLAINQALDKVFSLIFRSDGRWQFDDSNQSDYPIITTDLVSGQRDYSFVSDQSGNLILDIYKVMAKNSSTGSYIDLTPVDQQSDTSLSMTSGNNGTGVPTCYDKTANGIFLDLIPSYNSTDGLKVFINREGVYCTQANNALTNGSIKPGFAGLFHEYLALRPSYQFAYRKGLQNVAALQSEMLRMEQEIIRYYGNREKDTRKRLTVLNESNK